MCEREVHFLILIKWGLHMSLMSVSGVKVPDAGLGLLAFHLFFFSFASPSLDPFAKCKLHNYVKTPWFLWSLVRFTCAKEGLLTCKLCFGQSQKSIKDSPGLNQEICIWLLPFGGKKNERFSHYLGNFFQGWIIRSYQLLPPPFRHDATASVYG